MADKIFLIMSECYDYEDNSGREHYEFRYDPEEDSGFFLTEADAQAWIDKQTAEDQAKYDAKVAEHGPKQRLYEEKKAEADKAWEAYVGVMLDTGQKVSRVHKPYIEPPFMPKQSTFFTKYQIVSVEREV